MVWQMEQVHRIDYLLRRHIDVDDPKRNGYYSSVLYYFRVTVLPEIILQTMSHKNDAYIHQIF